MTPIDITSAAFLGAVVVGLVQAAKSAGVDSRYSPALSAGFGVLLGVTVGLATGETSTALLTWAVVGLAIGLGATGTYAVAAKVGGQSTSAAFPKRTRS